MIAKSGLNNTVGRSELSSQGVRHNEAGRDRASSTGKAGRIENTDRAKPTKATEAARPVNQAKPAETEQTALNMRSGDVASFSEDANIDLSLFSYFYKGGDAGEALTENKVGNGEFKPEPNFTGMSATRYSQMKSEIERNFAENPDLKNKYLRELDKTLEDYVRMQSKYAADSESESEGVNDEDTQDLAQDKLDKLMSVLGAGSKEVTAIIQKVLGTSESAMPEALSKIVDDYFVDVFRQKINSAENTETTQKLGAFSREVKEDPKTKSMWNAVRLHIDNEE